MLSGYGRAVFLFSIIFFSIGPVPCKSDIPVIKIDGDISPEKLPYAIKELKSNPHGSQVDYRSHQIGDLNGDGIDEYIWIFSNDLGGGEWRSACICYSDPIVLSVKFQENGGRPGARIRRDYIMDVWGDGGNEIILLKEARDSLFFEITTVAKDFATAEYCFLMAVGKNMTPYDSWRDLNIEPLGGIDLNGDGYRDFIYVQSAKLSRKDNPDSSLERGICAFDIKNNQRIWFFPTADGLSAPNFNVLRKQDGSIYFVFATHATNNRYSSNGMISSESYMLAIDQYGREIWRKTIGAGFFYPSILCFGTDSDTEREICLATDANMAQDSLCRMERYDPETGIPERNALILEKGRYLGIIVMPFHSENCAVITFPESGNSYFIDTILRVKAIIEGLQSLSGALDINLDGRIEYPALLPDSRLIFLDDNFQPIAAGKYSYMRCVTYNGPTIRGLFLNADDKGYILLGLEKRPLLSIIFARYKWWLAVAVAACLFAGILFFIRWLNRLYLSAQGLPSLDKMNAMAVILDRKGRIIYANSNPLSHAILGADSKRKNLYNLALSGKHQNLVDAIKKSYAQPFIHLQGRFEIAEDGKKQEIEWMIYPRVDKNNKFLGKIIIAEDVSGRADWERKIVLGEAAQRWVHKLKGSMATARITVENLEEDRRIAGIVGDNKILAGYLGAIKNQILDTADTAGKILRFVRITKPLMVDCGINQLIDRAVGQYIANPRPGITVAKKQQNGLPLIKADPEQIVEVIDNLLSNAIIAVKNNGTVTVTSQLAGDLPSNRPAAEVIIKDNGCGIDASDLTKIFEPGFSRSPNGTGIGLAIVKEILDNHGWKIRVESKLSQGTCFTISIPLEQK